MRMDRILGEGTCLLTISLVSFILSGCNPSESSSSYSNSSTLSSASLYAYQDELLPYDRPEKNVNLDLEIFPSSETLEAPERVFEQVFQWEEGRTTGSAAVDSEKSGYQGVGYVDGLESENDIVSLTVTVPDTFYYDLTVRSASYEGEKVNILLINGKDSHEFKTVSEDWSDTTVEKVWLKEGENTISFKKSWGWVRLDQLTVKTSSYDTSTLYEVPVVLSNPNAGEPAMRLMQFLTDIYGRYFISGQFQYGGGKNGVETLAIKAATGKYPALLGFDFMGDTPTMLDAPKEVSKEVNEAIGWWQEGGIVTFCWHWFVPKNVDNRSAGQDFYSEKTSFDIKKAIISGTKENEIILHHIDAIAGYLQQLQDAGVPVLWRPLHEASGGWFWWGAKGPQPYLELYRLLYDRLTNLHGLNNLIWVWNGQDAAWYPGDEYVDIIGEDIYPSKGDYSSQYSRFNKAVSYTSARKLITLSETSCVPSFELMLKDNARWSWFMIWGGDFVYDKQKQAYSQSYNTRDHIKEIYNHERVLTLDELPDLTNYPLK